MIAQIFWGKICELPMLGMTCENKFGFHQNLNVQAIFKLILYNFNYSGKKGDAILIYS